jgi:hypothetical protein
MTESALSEYGDAVQGMYMGNDVVRGVLGRTAGLLPLILLHVAMNV